MTAGVVGVAGVAGCEDIAEARRVPAQEPGVGASEDKPINSRCNKQPAKTFVLLIYLVQICMILLYISDIVYFQLLIWVVIYELF